MGLLGSSYYVKHPIIPIENSVAMINMDMIGQLKDRKLIAYGVGTASVFDSLIREHNKDSIFTLKLNNDGYGPSDHSSFYSKKIPVLHFFTDINEYYHRPMDTYDKLNYDGLKQIANFVSNIAFDLSNITHKPAFIATESPKPMGNVSRNTRVYVGTIPDFGEQTDGMKISGVREGSPAAKAGLQSGDIIIKFGRVDVKNLYDYTYALSEYKAGDTVQVVIKREKELLTLSVILGKRN
jgi:C-terminal processing protease CtpA/Prc